MQIRPDIMMTVAAMLIALTVPPLVYHKVRFKPLLTAQEKAVADFSPATLTIAKKAWQDSSLTLPVSAPPAPAPPATLPGKAPAAVSAGPAQQPAATPPKPSTPKVSMILHDGAGGGKAIIDGTPLKVGDKQGEWLLERIESNRVLLRGRKGTTWVSQD